MKESDKQKMIYTFRLHPAMEAWLKARAKEEGHYNKSLMLRMILTKEMSKAKSTR